MARHFFETNRQGPSAGPMFGAPPHLPPAEMARMGEISGRGGPDLHEAWARDQQQQLRAYEDAQNAWVAEFGSSGQHVLPGGSAQQNMSSRPECTSVISDPRSTLTLLSSPATATETFLHGVVWNVRE